MARLRVCVGSPESGNGSGKRNAQQGIETRFFMTVILGQNIVVAAGQTGFSDAR
jgi:hypothetical protein